MNEQLKEITREKLYEEIWRTPLVKLAVKWGVPVSRIIKAASQMNVPRPGSGHWQLVKLGWQVEQDELPSADAATPTMAVLTPGNTGPKQKQKTVAAPKVIIATDVHDLHEVVRRQYSLMKDAPNIEGGPLKLEQEGNFELRVSKTQLLRALFFLDALVKELEKKGATFVKSEEFDKPLVAKLQEGPVEFRVYEWMDHRYVPVKAQPRLPTGYVPHEWRYFPSGKLSFSVLGWYPKEVQKNWNDTKRQRIEDKLPDIIEKIVTYPKIAREQRESFEKKQAEAQRQWHEAYLRRTAPERLEKFRTEMVTDILRQAANWNRAVRMREFLEACEKQLSQGEHSLSEQGRELRWLNWGRERLEEIDPFTNGFFEELSAKFGELEALEEFVANLQQSQSDNDSA